MPKTCITAQDQKVSHVLALRVHAACVCYDSTAVLCIPAAKAAVRVLSMFAANHSH